MIMTMGIELTVQLAMGLIKALPQLIAALPQIISAILNGLGQSVSSMVEIGKNIVSGLVGRNQEHGLLAGFEGAGLSSPVS